MKKVLALALVVVALAACEKKAASTPAADSSAMMPVTHDSMAMSDTMAKPDSMMTRDTTKSGM